MVSVGKVHGDDLLYRFFLRLSESEPELFAVVPQLFVESMAIWLPLEVYQHSPVVLPWVVRDSKCRANKPKSIPDQWSAPNGSGYLRDYNSLIKSLPRSLGVRGPKGSRLNGKRMGTEFVASHIWRKLDGGQSANQVPILNTFVPNLVWLPSQIAKLSDLDGGIVQQTLKVMSHRIYAGAPIDEHLRPIVAEAWSMLPLPEAPTEIDVDLEKLNWFVSTERFLALRKARLAQVIDALNALDAGEPLTQKVIATRYTEGLPAVDADRRKRLLEFLSRFVAPPEASPLFTDRVHGDVTPTHRPAHTDD